MRRQPRRAPTPRGGSSTPPSSPVVTAPGGSSRPSGSCSGRPGGRSDPTPHLRIGENDHESGRSTPGSRPRSRGATRRSTASSTPSAAGPPAHGHELRREHVFIDEGYSGSRLDRPALDRLRDAAREGEFDVLGVYSPDRLARRYAYQVLLLEEFRKAGCAVEFVQRPISDDPHDQLLLQIQGAVAEYERAVLGERFRRGKLQKARAGHWVAGQAPYGYRYVPKRDGVPGAPGGRRGRGRGGPDALPLADRRADDRPPDPQAAGRRAVAAAQRQAALVEQRRPPHPLRPGLRRHGLRQPARASSRPRKPRSAGPRAGAPTCRQPRPREEWIPIPVPAIIDEATHQDASDQLARNSALSFRNNTRNDYLLRCLLTCRTCGLAMCGVTTQRGRRAAPAPLLQVPRQGHRGPGPGAPLPAAAGPRSRSSTRPSGATSSGCSTTRPRWPRSSRSWPGRPDAQDAGAARRARSGRPSSQRLDREEQRLLDAYQAEAIDLDELKAAPRADPGPAAGPRRPSATRSSGCRPSGRRRRRSGRT